MAATHRLILASASEGRRDLLTRAGYQFEVIPSNVEEPPFSQFSDPRACVQHTAWLKARAVATNVADGTIIAADSISWHKGRAIGKPMDEADARRILMNLAGTEHQLWTGVCLWRRPDDSQLCWQEVSLVRMAALSQEELDTYLASGVWKGKSGAYAIQEPEDPYIRVTSGTVSNVIGLPMERLSQAIHLLARYN